MLQALNADGGVCNILWWLFAFAFVTKLAGNFSLYYITLSNCKAACFCKCCISSWTNSCTRIKSRAGMLTARRTGSRTTHNTVMRTARRAGMRCCKCVRKFFWSSVCMQTACLHRTSMQYRNGVERFAWNSICMQAVCFHRNCKTVYLSLFILWMCDERVFISSLKVLANYKLCSIFQKTFH